MAVSGSSDPLSLTGIGGHIAGIDGRIRSLARSTNRFSWLSWGLLFAVYLGLLLWGIVFSLLPVKSTNGVGTSILAPWWDVFILAGPGVVLLYFVIREAVIGHREFSLGTSGSTKDDRAELEPAPTGWTETIQRCQQRLTHSKSEVEWSFVPLFLGCASLAWFVVANVQSVLFPGAGPIVFLVNPVVAFGSLLLLLPFYRYAQQWVAGYQRLLDRQVGELSKLEAEFLWRFAGAGVPG